MCKVELQHQMLFDHRFHIDPEAILGSPDLIQNFVCDPDFDRIAIGVFVADGWLFWQAGVVFADEGSHISSHQVKREAAGVTDTFVTHEPFF